MPGIMATRVIDNRRDRMVTILVAPLMSCSARLPVYLLLIGAFVPATAYLGGWVSLQGLVLFAMSSLGLVVAIPVAWMLKRFCSAGETPSFVMELPDYKVPSPRMVLYRVYDRGKAFVLRAGSLIFATTILVWAAAYFPGDHSDHDRLTVKAEALTERAAAAPDDQRLADELAIVESAPQRRGGAAHPYQFPGPRRASDRAGGETARLGLADRRGGDRLVPGAGGRSSPRWAQSTAWAAMSMRNPKDFAGRCKPPPGPTAARSTMFRWPCR